MVTGSWSSSSYLRGIDSQEGALATFKEQSFFVTAVFVRSRRKFLFSEGNISRKAGGSTSIV